MTKTCCVPNCRLNNDDPECLKLHFFQLPTNDDMKKKWCESIKNYFMQELQLKKYMYVCERHFEIKCFHYGPLGKNLRIDRGSYPTIFENYDDRDRQLQLSVKQEIDEQDLSHNCNDSVHQEELANARIDVSTILDSQEPDQKNFNKRFSHNNSFFSQYNEVNVSDNFTSDEKFTELHDDNQSDEDPLSLSSVQSEKSMMKKSMAHIDLQLIDYSNERIVRKIIAKAQEECIRLRKQLHAQTMKLHRLKKGMKSSNFLSDSKK